MELIFILLIALVLDLAFGEPSNALHPVAWLGKLISLEMRLAPAKGKSAQLAFGIIGVVITVGTVTTAAYFLLHYLREVNLIAYILLGGILLKFTFSLRGLRQAANTIRGLLAQEKLAEARFNLRALVSRDTTSLGESQIVAATVESIAENSCDSFVAPLFYFLIFGIPGAMAYRIINTFDAMIGYHGRWEYLGKFAARLDDVANFIPARITAFVLILASWLSRENARQAWRIMLRDHCKTESPNAGWTMSAAAGALEVRLEKVGHYQLGDNHNALTVNTIDASLQILMLTALIWSVISILVGVVYFVTT